MVSIKELASTVGFKGAGGRRTAEPSSVKTLPTIDNSLPNTSVIRTSLDCYVSGQYVLAKGKTLEVTQRYTIWVSYSKSTQIQTMTQVRDKIMQDFQDRYGQSFNISNVYVPQLATPTPEPGAQPAELYGGSAMYRKMTRVERARYEIGTQKQQARLNIESIKKRYNYRR